MKRQKSVCNAIVPHSRTSDARVIKICGKKIITILAKTTNERIFTRFKLTIKYFIVCPLTIFVENIFGYLLRCFMSKYYSLYAESSIISKNMCVFLKNFFKKSFVTK